jgi:hypothetical protein
MIDYVEFINSLKVHTNARFTWAFTFGDEEFGYVALTPENEGAMPLRLWVTAREVEAVFELGGSNLVELIPEDEISQRCYPSQ